MKPTSYAEIGLLLKRAREEMKLTVEQASKLLHIRARYLTALEEGKLTDLPGVAYTKGYLQAYAAFLNLDKDEIVRRFDQVEGALPRKGFYFPVVFSKRKTPSLWAVWGGLIMAIGVYALWQLSLKPEFTSFPAVEKYERKPEKVVLSAAILDDVACLRPQDLLYPPCTAASLHMSLTPLHGQPVTIMELAPPRRIKSKNYERTAPKPSDIPSD